MIIERAPSFKKSYQKRIYFDQKLVKRVEDRLTLFHQNPFHPILRNHVLTGTKKGMRAFWITGDIRIIYQRIDDNEVRFIDIGSHNQVY